MIGMTWTRIVGEAPARDEFTNDKREFSRIDIIRAAHAVLYLDAKAEGVELDSDLAVIATMIAVNMTKVLFGDMEVSAEDHLQAMKMFVESGAAKKLEDMLDDAL